MRIRTLLLVPVLWLGLLTFAHADEKPDYEAAKKNYKEAVAAEAAGDYATAADKYAAAYAITKDPILFYKIANAYEKGGDKDAAIIYYRRYVNEAKDAKDRDAVKAHIAELEGEQAPPDDGGDGVLEPPDDGGDGVLEPPDDGGVLPPDDGLPPDQPPTFMDEPSRWTRTAAWVSVGVAAVFLTTGAVFGESALSRQEDLERLIDFRNTTDQLPLEYSGTIQSDYEDARDEGERFERLALISFAGAGVAAIAAGVFFYLDATRERPAAAPREATTTFLRPYVGHDLGSAGIVAGWEF